MKNENSNLLVLSITYIYIYSIYYIYIVYIVYIVRYNKNGVMRVAMGW